MSKRVLITGAARLKSLDLIGQYIIVTTSDEKELIL